MTNRIILSGILWITALVAAAQVSYLDRITVETKAVRKVDDNVTVDLLWQFAGLKPCRICAVYSLVVSL